MTHEPEFVRERHICGVLEARGARDARDGLPEDPDPLSHHDLVDLSSFYLSEPEYLANLFLNAYRDSYRLVSGPAARPGRGNGDGS